MKYITIILLFFCASLTAQDPNIILIVADDMGYGDISRNDTMYSTPIIDSLANNGAYFDYYYSSPGCTPTRTSLMSGRYNHKLGMHVSVILRFEERHLPLEQKILPEFLQDRGYMTGMTGKWHLGHAQPEHLPDARGFEWTKGVHTFGQCDYFNYQSDVGYNSDGGVDLIADGQPDTAALALSTVDSSRYFTFLTGDYAVDFVEKNANTGNPFFLYVPFLAPHRSDTPGDENQVPPDSISIAPAGYSAQDKAYYVLTKIMDNQVGRIWSAVRDNGIEDNTIIIFLSDNGGDTRYGGNNKNLKGRKGQITDGGMRVPMIYYHKNTVTPQVVDSMVFAVDILPTILNRAGATLPDSLDGNDLYPLISGGSFPARTMIGYYIPGTTWAIYKSGIKLCNNCESFTGNDTPQAESLAMYDIYNDPGEATDIIGSNTTLRDEMKAALDSQQAVDFETTGTAQAAPPVGWVAPLFWGTSIMFSNTGYYYYQY